MCSDVDGEYHIPSKFANTSLIYRFLRSANGAAKIMVCYRRCIIHNSLSGLVRGDSKEGGELVQDRDKLWWGKILFWKVAYIYFG